MSRLVPLWATAFLVLGGWIAGRVAGAATGSLSAVLIAGFTVSVGGLLRCCAARATTAARAARGLHPRNPAHWLRANGPRASFRWYFHAAHGIALSGMGAAVVAVYALNSVLGWTDEPAAGPNDASDLLAFVCSLIVYPGLHRHAEILLERRSHAARRRRRGRLDAELRALRAQSGESPPAVAPLAGDGGDQGLEEDWELVVGWRYSHFALIVVLLFGGGSAGIVLLLLSDVHILGKVAMVALITVFVAIATWIQVASAIGHRLALHIDETGVNIAERGVMPWKEIQGCVLFVVDGVRYFSVVPRADKDALLGAAWTTAEMRRAVRLRGTCMTVPARQLAATPAALALAFEQLGHPLGHME